MVETVAVVIAFAAGMIALNRFLRKKTERIEQAIQSMKV